MVTLYHLLNIQKDLMAIMISQTDIRQLDLRSSVSEVVGGDAEIMQVMEE